VGPERTGTPFRFFLGQPEQRSGSFLYKNSSQQCIRKCYLNSGGLQKPDDLAELQAAVETIRARRPLKLSADSAP